MAAILTTTVSTRSRSSSTTWCLIIVFMCSLLSPSSRGEDDRQCLRAFKASVKDSNNGLLSWKFGNSTPGSVCNFGGVTCWNAGENKVMALKLQWFGLAGDPFPEGLHKCTSLQTLDLSSNSFSNMSLPADLCKMLPDLTSLDLSHNQFFGEIPSSLGQDCLYLQSLQLQGKLLSGEIPWELGTLPRLQVLNLSQNLLSGPIPYSFINQSRINLTASAFQGNPHLCGPPLSSSCHSPDGPHPVHYIEIALGAAGAALLLLLTAFLLRRLQRQRSLNSSNSTSVEMFDPYLRLSWNRLEKATSNFSHANILGIAGSSTVYKGQLLDGRMIAIKVLQKEDNCSLSCDVRKQFLTELEVLGKLRHRNLVRILGYCYNLHDTMTIIIDFMPMGSLDALLHPHTTLPLRTPLASNKGHSQQLAQSPNISWEARFHILRGIAEGLAYLHHEYDGKRCIIHGDLKPGNVLLDEHMEAHIADFGLATMVQAANTTSISMPSLWRRVLSNARGWSFGYTAPECAQQGVVTRKADVFSFGMTMLELMTGERPSSSKLEEGQTLADWVGHALASGAVQELVNADEGTWKKWEADIVAILKLGCRCTSHKPSARPDMQLIVAFLHDLAHKQHSASHLVSTIPFQSSQPNNEDELWMLANTS